MTTDLILGTAGHIDHGKTSLIRALTGAETDRLPEEKKRGITIELGFAELTLGDYRLGIVDVPGHERFVRQMLAGATSMDLVMLVVAADDSVKQQTCEHLEILRLLDLPTGVIVLSKCDMAEEDWLDLVEEDIRELVENTFLADAPIVRSSATTGRGIEQLKAALEVAAHTAAAHRQTARRAPFRMAIDRVFTMAGHGTVVTGSVATGAVDVGDHLRLQPGDVDVRVRGIQNHDRTVDTIHRGQRAAINLSGVHYDEITRGQELAAAGHLHPSRLLTVQLSALDSMPRPLKNRTRVRVHVGTTEALANVRMIGTEELLPGDTAMVQLFLQQPVVTTWNQPVVLRSESPVTTIAGGRVLHPSAQPIRHQTDAVRDQLANLTSNDETTRAAAAAYFSGLSGWSVDDIHRTAGVHDLENIQTQLLEQGELKRLTLAKGRQLLLHRQVLHETGERIEELLLKLHQQNPLRSSHPRLEVIQRLDWLAGAAEIEAVLDKLAAAGRVTISGERVTLAGHGPKLSKSERQVYDDMLAQFREAGANPPSLADVQKLATKNRHLIPQLIELALADGLLIEFAQGLYLHAECERHARESITAAMQENGSLTVAEIRDALGTTRKFAIPLCEYFDRIRFTQRDGDQRVLAE